ncbi:MAG: hypothetical protein AABZ24_03670, partial [Nitrospirota bacterium]
RAAAAGEPVPVVMCAHPYDNHLTPALGKTPFGGPPLQYRMVPQVGRPVFSTLTSWEAPDPNFWIPNGYAVVNMNLPGYANSVDVSGNFAYVADYVDGLLMMEAARTPAVPQRTTRLTSASHQRGATMLYYGLLLLVFGLMTGALNFAGGSAGAVQTSWMLFLIGIVLLVIHWITGRTTRPV